MLTTHTALRCQADAALALPRERLLFALVSVYRLVSAALPPAGRRLVTRQPTAADAALALASLDPSAPALDFDSYEQVCRDVFRRLAVDRGRRAVVGVALGCAVVAAVKGMLRRTPLVGPVLHAVFVPLLPMTAVAGPALGLAVCAHWGQHGSKGGPPTLQAPPRSKQRRQGARPRATSQPGGYAG